MGTLAGKSRQLQGTPLEQRNECDILKNDPNASAFVLEIVILNWDQHVIINVLNHYLINQNQSRLFGLKCYGKGYNCHKNIVSIRKVLSIFF